MRARKVLGGMLLGTALGALGCDSTAYRASFVAPNAPPPAAPAPVDAQAAFVKCHMADGSVFVLERWQMDEKEIHGHGIFYGADRSKGPKREYRVPVRDVLLVETNRPERFTRSNIPVMAIVSVVSLAVTAVCIAEPKTCFGSCPTFYAFDGERRTLQAEGFSASIARSLEARDVDALVTARPTGSKLELLVTNEALETHAIRKVAVLAAPRREGERVFRDGERYFRATALTPPSRCVSELGDCRAAVKRIDSLEYASPADAHDLAARETIELGFAAKKGPLGLVVVGRNSLLNTFLFYQALAYMGTRAGEVIARLERGGVALEMAGNIGRALGDVEVSVLARDGTWQKAGAFSEVGPIAREAQLVVLPEQTARDEVRVRLTATRGNWKLDSIALAELGEQVTPVRVPPARLLVDGKLDAAKLELLKAGDRHLFTYPGDSLELEFDLPPGEHELFLESTGYYYEWMRESWLADESVEHFSQMLLDPGTALRRLAPDYKRIESSIDRLFWQSRVPLPPKARPR